MIARIRTFFRDQILDVQQSAGAVNGLKRATAALLVEVMVTDQVLDETEIHHIRELLEQRFQLSPADTLELLQLARQEVAEATSLYQFTGLVNEHFSARDKFDLVRQLWEVAYVDGALDKHEEALIRRIAELIHLPHAAFVLARNQARDDRLVLAKDSQELKTLG